MPFTRFFFLVAVVLEGLALAAAIAAVIRTLSQGLRKAMALAVAAPLFHLASFGAVAAGMTAMYRHFGRAASFGAEFRAVLNDPLARGILPVALLAFAFLLAVATFFGARRRLRREPASQVTPAS